MNSKTPPHAGFGSLGFLVAVGVALALFAALVIARPWQTTTPKVVPEIRPPSEKNMRPTSAPQPPVVGQPTYATPSTAAVQIPTNDQSCTLDTDCVIVSTICSTCECGMPVNKMHEQKYVDVWKVQCKNYHGGICDYLCRTPFAKCLSGKCVLSESP
ncbi:MAG: hypothetical protein Q8R39_04190 [bacterium]|nr:hypothetical protein [bacterium]MDZ4284488.1 hypothetical protein [Patescibacteria group bacterium]